MLQPSLTMWCMVQQQHVLVRRPAAAARARSSGPARQVERARAPPRAASRPRLRLARLRGRPRRSARPAARTGAAGAITCTGSPSTSREGGAQRLVPRAPSRPARAPARAASSAPAQPQRDGHVVGGAPRLQPVQEPEPLLRERERQRPRPGRPHDRRRGRPAALAPERLHAPGQLGHGGRLEQVSPAITPSTSKGQRAQNWPGELKRLIATSAAPVSARKPSLRFASKSATPACASRTGAPWEDGSDGRAASPAVRMAPFASPIRTA